MTTAAHNIVLLWRHEAERAFADKLTNLPDKSAFSRQLDTCTQLVVTSDTSMGGRDGAKSGGPLTSRSTRSRNGARTSSKSPSSPSRSSQRKEESDDQQSFGGGTGQDLELIKKCTKSAYFVDFLREDDVDEDGVLIQAAPRIFEIAGTLDAVRSRTLHFLGKLNDERPSRKMNLVMFDDALRHLIRISRVLGTPGGNMLLVGVGGSGKQSLTHLAAYIAGHELCQISLTKAYNMNSFVEDVRNIYKVCGQQCKKATFLLTDAQIKDAKFLDLLNSLLKAGESNDPLFAKDELQLMASELRPEAAKQPNFVDTPEFLARNFYDTVRANLHIVLCFSPVHPKFTERTQNFPGLTSGCAIDWFLPWPADALVAVSEKVISSAPFSSANNVSTSIADKALTKHMAFAHQTIVDCCDEYVRATRRHVYQTPSSYLSFLNDYEKLYVLKLREIETKASRVKVGLENLAKGGQDVEAMSLVLASEEAKLKMADETTTEMLKKLQSSSLEAKKEADAVMKIKMACEADAKRIAGEKADAERDLGKAQPFVEEAERAVNSIKPNDLNELKKLQKPSDIIKLIFDVVGLLKMEKLNKVETSDVTLGIGKEKRQFPFMRDSYKLMQQGLLSDARFLQSIFHFSKNEKDFITDETIELMRPYTDIAEYNPLVARNASKAAEGLCAWSIAMISYHEASKMVKPKLEALRVAEARLTDAQMKLDKAEAKLQGCTDILAALQSNFESQMKKKEQIRAGAAATRKRMEKATALIGGLAGERERWKEDSSKFDIMKTALVGDVALACAFISYCGPFNQEYRTLIVRNKLAPDLKAKKIPHTSNLDVTNFLVDVAERQEWNLQGLPTDPLSIENGAVVTHSSRYPL